MIRKVFFACQIPAIFVLALMVGLLMQSMSIPTHSRAQKAAITTLRFIERVTNNTIIDNGTHGDSPGDLLVFSNTIVDAAFLLNAGHSSGFCVRTIIGTAYDCRWTIFLTNGQLTVEGPLYDHADSTLTIVGGTGTYNLARGQMLIHARDTAGSAYDYTYYLST